MPRRSGRRSAAAEERHARDRKIARALCTGHALSLTQIAHALGRSREYTSLLVYDLEMTGDLVRISKGTHGRPATWLRVVEE